MLSIPIDSQIQNILSSQIQKNLPKREWFEHLELCLFTLLWWRNQRIKIESKLFNHTKAPYGLGFGGLNNQYRLWIDHQEMQE